MPLVISAPAFRPGPVQIPVKSVKYLGVGEPAHSPKVAGSNPASDLKPRLAELRFRPIGHDRVGLEQLGRHSLSPAGLRPCLPPGRRTRPHRTQDGVARWHVPSGFESIEFMEKLAAIT